MSDWQSAVLSVVINTLTVLDILLILQVFFGIERCKRLWHYGVVGGVFAILNIGLEIWLSEEELIYFIAVCVYIAAAAVVFTKKQRWKPFLLVLPALLLYLQWDSIVSLFDLLFHFGKNEHTLAENSVNLYNLVTDASLLILLLLILRQKPERSAWFRFTKGETLLVSFFCLFCPVLTSVLQYLDELFRNFMYSMAWVAFVLVLNFAVFYGIFHRKKARYYRAISENYKQQFNEEYQYFKDYKKEQKEIARFRHDWNNHLLLLTSLFEQGEYEKAKEYFENLSEKNQTGRKGILTGNETVDIILNAKAERLEKGAIAVSCSSGLEALGFMEPVDCCILFANLIDNAIEANEKCEGERYIRIALSENAGNIMLSIENQWNGEWKLADGKPVSTKEDAETHGVGTRNAFAVVEKYHGTYRLITKKGCFAVQMIFSIER